MDTTSLVLTSLLTVALVILLSPAILSANRGKVLRNIALWLAIFMGLGLVYRFAGPESQGPQAVLTQSQQGPERGDDTPDDDQNAPLSPNANDNEQGYFPPKED